MSSKPNGSTSPTQVRLTRHSPSLWRVTFDIPPLNIFGPDAIPPLNAIVSAMESDKYLKVVVFDSAVEGVFLNHYDFFAKLEDTTSLPAGPTGLQPLPDMFVRISRAPVVSIASIRGRATGVGSEIALACDMRFASREKAILSQWEVGVGLVPGGGPIARLPRLLGRGRAAEVLLGADDFPGDLAELEKIAARTDLRRLVVRSRVRPVAVARRVAGLPAQLLERDSVQLGAGQLDGITGTAGPQPSLFAVGGLTEDFAQPHDIGVHRGTRQPRRRAPPDQVDQGVR